MSIAPNAIIGEGSEISPMAIIEDGVKVGKNCKILPFAMLLNGVEIGDNVEVGNYAVIGGEPQVKDWKKVPSYVKIGNNCVIREYVTVNRAQEEGKTTTLGKNCFIMAYAHIAHDCFLADDVVVVNYTAIPGHIEVGRKAFISGYVGMHQFIKIGELAMISGLSRIPQDVPPFFIYEGNPVSVRTINKVGLERDGKSKETIKEIKEAFRIIYKKNLPLNEAIKELETTFNSPEIKTIVDFCKSSTRGIVR